MPWLKLDDRMGEHRKTRRLLRKGGLAPMGLHALAMLHAARYLTDGFVDAEYVEEVLDAAKIRGKARTSLPAVLVENGQWEPVEGGWLVHDYLDYNPTRAQVEDQRRRDAERKAAGRNGRTNASPAPVRAKSGRTAVGQHAESDRPDPTRPDHREATPPVALDDARSRLKSEQVVHVFDAWAQATERDSSRTKLTADRRRRIEKALASHGLEDCLAAVQHIGADAWARGANDRHRRFDDIEHALGNAERIERWRDQAPRAVAAQSPHSEYEQTRARRAAALASLQGGAAA